MYRRMVFLGLGGSGGKTLRFLRRDLRHWLTKHGWPEDRDIPAGFQFLHIDTPTVQDGRSMGGAVMMPDREYVGLVGADTTYEQVATQLDNKRGVKEEFAGWRVDPSMVKVPITDGAGAFRAIGRTIALAYIEEIQSALGALVDRASSADSIAELNELWQLTHNNNYPTGSPSDPVVVVVSSLAGGTGAGLLLDVFDVLRALKPSWGDKSFGILYTPEVFDKIPGRMTPGGVQPNSLAAISELLNGYYWHGTHQGSEVDSGPTEIGFKQPKILASAGVIASLSRSGPAYPFLVGSKNAANISFNTDRKVFETVGSALLAWCVDEVVQDQLIAFTMTNWTDKSTVNVSASDLLINKGLPPEVALPSFNALGCARVSVGTRYLERYATRRLARDAATYIAGYHIDSEDAKAAVKETQSTQPEELSRHIAKNLSTWFINKCEMDERGPDANQILDAIRPLNVGALDLSARSQARSQVDIGKAGAEKWIQSIVGAIQQATIQYQQDYRPHLDARVKAWVESAPQKVIQATEEAIAYYGLSVAVDLLDELSRYLADPINGIAAELMGESEHGSYRHYSAESEWATQVQAVLGSSKGNFTLQTNEKIDEAIDRGLSYACYFAEAELREVVSPLLVEFVKGFLHPLRRSLADEFIRLQRMLGEIGNWPTWSDGTPPEDVTPPDSEYTLIEPDKFSRVFVQTLARTVSNDKIEVDKLEEHRAVVRADVISGAFLRKMEDYAKENATFVRPLQAISITKEWHPGMQFVRDTNRPQSSVQVDVKFTAEDLEARAGAWLRRSNTPFNDLLSSSLRSYTTGDAVFNTNIHVSEIEYEDRRRDFLAQMTKAIQASAPLVSIDRSLLPSIHDERPFRRQFSQLPFSGHPLENQIVNLVRPYVGSETEEDSNIVGRYLTNDDKVDSVQIISTLNGAHHPFLFESLLDPIARRWNGVKDTTGERDQFWSMRRARPLGEAIPAPQEHIIAMIRGWFTGRVLGLIDPPDSGDPRPTLIAQPWSLEKVPAPFPYPFLTSPSDRFGADKLFAVLESLSLAYVLVSQQNNLLPLRPYIILRDMGSMLDGSPSVLAYDRPNPLLESWITTGSISVSFSTENGKRTKSESDMRSQLNSRLHERLAVVVGADPVARRDALLSWLTDTMERYSNEAAAQWDAVEKNRRKLNEPPFWISLRNTSSDPDLVSRALRSLKHGISKLDFVTTSDV